MQRVKSKKKPTGAFKSLMLSILVGANMVSVLLMLACGFSVYLSPELCEYLVPFELTYPIYLVVNLMFLVIWIAFSPKYVFISLAGIIIGFNAIRTYCPINFPDPHPQGCLKVMSYNIMGFASCNWNQDESPSEMLDYLSNSDADILCLQEFQMPFNKAHAADIEKVLNRWPYRKIVNYKSSGIGILSRYPILKTIPIYDDSMARGSAAHIIKYKGDSIMVINNHFISTSIDKHDQTMYKNILKKPEDVNIKSGVRYLSGKLGKAGVHRARQADTVAAFISHHPEIPIIVCGDFNDSPISYARYKVARNLQDAFVKTGRGLGISYHQAGMYFRIDHILYSKHWQPYSAQVDSHVSASDHYPIIAHFKLNDN